MQRLRPGLEAEMAQTGLAAQGRLQSAAGRHIGQMNCAVLATDKLRLVTVVPTRILSPRPRRRRRQRLCPRRQAAWCSCVRCCLRGRPRSGTPRWARSPSAARRRWKQVRRGRGSGGLQEPKRRAAEA